MCASSYIVSVKFLGLKCWKGKGKAVGMELTPVKSDAAAMGFPAREIPARLSFAPMKKRDYKHNGKTLREIRGRTGLPRV